MHITCLINGLTENIPLFPSGILGKLLRMLNCALISKLCIPFFANHEQLCAFLACGLKQRAVKENCRRQGHGEALLKAAIERCRTRNIQRIGLHVDPLRTAAMNLYKKLGFHVDSLIEGYYSADRDAYRMYLEF